MPAPFRSRGNIQQRWNEPSACEASKHACRRLASIPTSARRRRTYGAPAPSGRRNGHAAAHVGDPSSPDSRWRIAERRSLPVFRRPGGSDPVGPRAMRTLLGVRQPSDRRQRRHVLRLALELDRGSDCLLQAPAIPVTRNARSAGEGGIIARPLLLSFPVAALDVQGKSCKKIKRERHIAAGEENAVDIAKGKVIHEIVLRQIRGDQNAAFGHLQAAQLITRLSRNLPPPIVESGSTAQQEPRRAARTPPSPRRR